MSYNGSGTFVINSTGQPVVANTVISATVFNALTADLATGLSTAITKDGQTTITANIPFGSNKITALGAGTAATDAANLSQVQTTAAKLINVTGTDTITGTMTPQLTSYAAGQLFYFVAAGANTGAVTINIDGLGAKSVTRDGSTALANGDINSGEVVVLVYDGTRFQMINAANSFGNTTINGTLTVTGNTGLQANVSITSALSVGGTFNVTGAAALGSTLAVTGKSDLPTVSTASINAAVALITTGTVTNLTSTSASVASINAAVALITTGTVTALTATGASVASANVGTAVVTGLTVTNASIASLNAGTATVTSGNLTFSSTAQRITGDFSNATQSNRLSFQSSTTNGNTAVGAIPNGTSQVGSFIAFNNSDPTNAAFIQIQANGSTEARINSSITGTGTYLPMTFYTSSSERMRLDTSGNVGIGRTPTAGYRLDVAAGTAEVLIESTTGTNRVDANLVNTSGTFAIGIDSSTGGVYGTAYARAIFATGAYPVVIFTNSTERMRITSAGNIVAGASAALATTATDGFLYVPTCAGTPTGTPTAITGMAPIVVNTTNNKLYFYSGGAWRDAGP